MKTRPFALRSLFFVGILALAACAAPAPRDVPPRIDYGALGVMRLDVRTVTVDDRYLPPLRAPHVEHEFPNPLYTVVNEWANRRFQAVGAVGSARLVILEASAVHVNLPVKQGLAGLVTSEQSDKYLLKMKVRLEVDSPLYNPPAFAEVVIERNLTTTELETLGGRERKFQDMTVDMLRSLDDGMIGAINKNLIGIVL